MAEADDILDGRYRITQRVGAGGMGEVYRAERIRLGDEVAIKFIRAESGDDPRSRERFVTEGRASAALRHPNIVSVLDYGVASARGPFLVMEYLNGPSVAQEIAASGPFDVERARRILADLASALDLAHSIGLVHRDLKPANIVAHRYGDGEVVYKIIDFGIGKMLKNTAAATTVDGPRIFGSLPYAPPEQLLGKPVDSRADVYGLGALAFEMLTGHPPFAEKDVSALLTRVLFESPPKPSALRRDLDQRVDEAVLRSLEKEPDRRWQTATEFADALAGAPSAHAAPIDVRSASGLDGRYELGERLGTGRLGSEIYAGKHRAIGSSVVVRILRRGDSATWETGRTRFLREARAMQVAHPSILQVRDFGEESDLVYIVTDRIAGPSLRELIDAEKRLPWVRARRLTLDLIGAGQALHRGGGLIFGITPTIVRVQADGEERLVVSSAGIAEVQDVLAGASEERLRTLQIPNNELLYVAPEVLLGEKPDGRTDIYSIGVIAYEMVTGRPPFTATTVPQLMGKIFSGAFADICELAPDVPGDAAQLIARCLAQRPDRRFADLAELQTAWFATPPLA